MHIYQGLVDEMAVRLLSDSEKEFSKAIHSVNAAVFPSELAPEYREEEIKYLCTKFGLTVEDLKVAKLAVQK